MVILNQLDEVEKAKEDQESFKRALAARADMDLKKMWPEYFQEEQREEPDGGGTVTPDDLRDVDWKSPKDDPKGWEEMMALLSKGSMSGADVTGSAEPASDIEWTEWR